jgi:hypothetical protein
MVMVISWVHEKKTLVPRRIITRIAISHHYVSGVRDERLINRSCSEVFVFGAQDTEMILEEVG